MLSVDEQNDMGISVSGPAEVVSRDIVPYQQWKPLSPALSATRSPVSWFLVLLALAAILIMVRLDRR